MAKKTQKQTKRWNQVEVQMILSQTGFEKSGSEERWGCVMYSRDKTVGPLQMASRPVSQQMSAAEEVSTVCACVCDGVKPGRGACLLCAARDRTSYLL